MSSTRLAAVDLGMHPPTPDELAALEEFLAESAGPEGSLTLGELYGFLFAVASAPEIAPMGEVLEFALGDAMGRFETPEHADAILGCIAGLYNQVNEGVVNGDPSLPASVVFRAEPMDNFDPDCPVAQWARGFVRGHNWLDESWDLELPEEMAEELPAVLMVLSLFWSRERADEYDAERDPDEPPLEVMAEKSVRFFQDAMGSYASMGRAIYLAQMEVQGAPPIRRDPVPGRNDPCPCGSGRKYKKCCGASVH